MSRCERHVSSRTHSIVYKMNCHKERGKQQAPDVLNNSCRIHTVLNNNNCTAPRSVRQTHTIHAVLTKTTHVWTQLERILETLKHSLKTSRVATGKYSYQSRESPYSSSALGTACSTTIQTVKVGDQLLPRCRFSMYCRCIRRCLPSKPWSVTCGLGRVDCVLLWNVLRFTNLCTLSTRNRPGRMLFSIFCLGHSTVPRRWAASADSERFICSWPHAQPALFSRLLLLLQHFLMNLEIESAVLATPVFLSFTRFK